MNHTQPNKYLRLNGKSAIITGAACGIGAATAELFADHGADVIIVDISDEHGKALETDINNRLSESKQINRAIFYHMDAAKEDEWIKLIDFTIKEFGRLDILFNNAGILGLDKNHNLGPQDPENASLDSWNFVHNVNLNSVFLGCKHGIKAMKNNPQMCSIINMSSRSGMVGVPNTAAYASSKAAIRNHTKTVALYCAQNNYGIRCNSLHPAAILTPLWDQILGDKDSSKRPQRMEKINQGIPLGKMGEPIDVAYAALYLASNESKYVTGAEIVIDGGILAGSSSSPSKNHN